jgi:hypothetical protein
MHQSSMDLRAYWLNYRMSEPEFSISDTLQLACTLSDVFISCLGTPILNASWNLSNFTVFTCQSGDFNATLDTLHVDLPINEEISSAVSRTLATLEADYPNSKETAVGSLEAELIKHLGVALLEIELGPSFQDMETVKEESFYSSSSLLYLENPLGPIYRKITKYCLNFDISHGRSCTMSLLKETLYDEVNDMLHQMFQYISE